MIKWTLQKIVGSKNQRELKKMRPVVAKINELEEQYQKESVEQLLARVEEWQKYLHRFLPLQLPTKRELELMDDAIVGEIASGLMNRLDSLREEFPQLPSEISSLDDISAAKTAFAEIEDDFPVLCVTSISMRFSPKPTPASKTPPVVSVRIRGRCLRRQNALGDGSLRCAAHRRHRSSPRHDFRNADR